MFKVAFKNLLGHKLRTFFTAVAIALGVGFMAGTFVLTDTIAASFDDVFTEANSGLDAKVRGKTAFEAEAVDGGQQRPDIDPALVDTVRGVEGVEVAEPTVFGLATLLDRDGEPLAQAGPSFGSNWTGNPEVDGFNIVEGEGPDAPDEAAIDQSAVDSAGFSIGDTIRVQAIGGTLELKLVGIAKFGESGNLAGASFVLIPTEAAIEQFAIGGRVQEISVIAEEGVSEQEVVDNIEEVLPDTAEALTAEEYTDESQEMLGVFVDQLRVALSIFAAVSLIAGAFLIYNTFGIIIGQRVRELALLRSLGAGRSQVLWSVLVESAAVGLVASILGLLGGIVLAIALKALFGAIGFELPGLAPVVAPRTVIVSIVVGVVITVVSSMVPALRASRVAPLAALREFAAESATRSTARTVIGLVLVALGVAGMVRGATEYEIELAALGTVALFTAVVVLGPSLTPIVAAGLGAPLRVFGIAATLGRDNARRNPKRSAGTVASLMLAVTIITFFAIFALSFGKSINAATDEYFNGDLEAASSGFGFPSIGPDLVDNLAEAPEVGAVTGVQRGVLKIDGRPRPVYGVRASDVTQVFDLQGVEGDLAGLGAEEIALDRATAEVAAWGIGKELEVTYPDGTSGVLTVAAIYEDAGIIAQNADGHYLLSDQVFRTHFPAIGQYLTRVDVKAADGVSVDELRRVVEAEAKAFPSVEVRDVNEIKDENNRQLQQSLGLFFVLLGLALVIGALGVTITLALSVFERTREIGLLRAVGATRRQMAGAVCVESVVLTLLGTLLGLAIGIAGGAAVVQTQADTIDTLRIAIPPFFVGGVLVLAVIVGVTASVVPAFRAARLDVLKAVTVE